MMTNEYPFPITRDELIRWLSKMNKESIVGYEYSRDNSTIVHAVAKLKEQRIYLFSTNWYYRNNPTEVHDNPTWVVNFLAIADHFPREITAELALRILEG